MNTSETRFMEALEHCTLSMFVLVMMMMMMMMVVVVMCLPTVP
jgi:hypothetical protein